MKAQRGNQVAGLVAGLTVKDATASKAIIERFKKAASVNSDRQLAIAMGLKLSSVSTAKSKGIIPPSWVINASNLFAVSSDWLITGIEPMEFPEHYSHAKFTDDYVQVPRVATELAAGGGSFLDSATVVEELAFRREWLAHKGQLKDLVVMTIYGDSMLPTLHEKDIALINLSQTKPHTGQIYAVGHDEALYIKRLVCEPGRLIMRSDNRSYSDIVLDFNNQAIMDKLKIIGRAVWWCHDERN